MGSMSTPVRGQPGLEGQRPNRLGPDGWLRAKAAPVHPPDSPRVPPSVEPVTQRSVPVVGLDELRAFFEAAHDMAKLSRRIVETVGQRLGCQRVSLMLVDAEAQVLRIGAACGIDAEVVQSVRARVGEGVAGWVAESGSPVLVEGGGADACRSGRPYASDSFLCVPVSHGQRVLGVLSVTDPARRLLLETADLEELRRLADVFGVAIHQAQMFEQAKELAVRDDLTGLHNRRYLRHFLDHILHRARCDRFCVSVIIFDLDHFKGYNDTYGHPAGDRVLQDVGRLMHLTFRSHDVVCRYGGEEFAVVLWDREGQRTLNSQHPVEALAFADRLRDTVAKQSFPHIKRRADVHLTISGGLATYPWDGTTRQQLVSKADQALYRAKRDGRNRIYLSGPALS